MNYLTVAELAKMLGVTPQGINKFLRENDLRSKLIKSGNKFLIDRNLAETIRNHFRPNEQGFINLEKQAETRVETAETKSETAETRAETSGNEETPGQAAFFKEKADQLETRLREQKETIEKQLEDKQSEVEFLRQQVRSLTEQNGKLIERNEKLLDENNGIKNQLLLAAANAKADESEREQVEAITVDDVSREGAEVEPETLQEEDKASDSVDVGTILKDLSIWDFFKLRKQGRNG